MGWKTIPELVKVDWADATNIATWMSQEDIIDWLEQKTYVSNNVGYLVYEDDDCVVVAARQGNFTPGEYAWGLVERIPKPMVLGVTYLESKS